ncbi:unnamed protein product, partial [Darwinula stevensoni]
MAKILPSSKKTVTQEVVPAKPTHKRGKQAKKHLPSRFDGKAFGVTNQGFDPNAIEVTKVLQQAGYEAYIVGGAVRDLLLGIKPKDFDVATSATPEQVRDLFRRARLIGRRFQIVHVYFGRDVIEVTTFRGQSDDAVVLANHRKTHLKNVAGDAVQDEGGRLLRDNVWGTLEEDANRRDFTINAFYYDPSNEQLIDLHDGISDLKTKSLRLIGDPVVRYTEDPVRMLRAVRLMAKTACKIEKGCLESIPQLAPQLAQVSTARLFDESLKLLLSGHALEGVDHLAKLGLLPYLLPILQENPKKSIAFELYKKSFITHILQATDQRLQADLSVSPGFLLAGLLWPSLCEKNLYWLKQGEAPLSALQIAIQDVISEQQHHLPIPARLLGTMREIWLLQPRLEKRTVKTVHRVVESPRYRAAYDFLWIRADVSRALNHDNIDPINPSLPEWWDDFANGDDQKRMDLIDSLKNSGQMVSAPKKRRRRRPKPMQQNDASGSSESGANLGNCAQTIQDACVCFAQHPAIDIEEQSSFYISEPLFALGPAYINNVIKVNTELTPHQLLKFCQQIETQFGRERPYINAPRTLDIDIILYDDLRVNDIDLCIPHPRMTERAFVLLPLLEIAPCVVLPSGLKVSDCLPGVATQNIRKETAD